MKKEMTLQQYMDTEGLKKSQIATMVGKTSAHVTKWLNGSVPVAETRKLIAEKTGGAVTIWK